MNTELYEYKNIKALVRPETSDSFVVREVMSGEYSKLKITEKDIIVDFGLNIGMFTIFALNKGARKVYSFEPEKENFNLAVENVAMNISDVNRYKLYNDAVVGNNDSTREFSINIKKNKGAHSLVKKRGRDTSIVTCQNINTILDKIKPTIVKMDIEGGEYECLKALKNNFKGVREFIMEFHHNHLNDYKTHEKYNEILELLRTMFDNVNARADTKGAWVNIVHCTNKD